MSVVNKIERIVKRSGSVLTIRADSTITAAAHKMGDNGIGCLIVVNAQRHAVGIISERDVLTKVVARSANPGTVTVAEAMEAPIIACTLSTSIDKAQQVMASHGIRHLPIIENGVPVGMISSRDILAHELSQARAVAVEQSKFIDELEETFPGITDLRKDRAGRIVI